MALAICFLIIIAAVGFIHYHVVHVQAASMIEALAAAVLREGGGAQSTINQDTSAQ